jgi:hypothetical protein
MFSRWIVTNITSGSVTTFLEFLAGTISWSVYCTLRQKRAADTATMFVTELSQVKYDFLSIFLHVDRNVVYS